MISVACYHTYDNLIVIRFTGVYDVESVSCIKKLYGVCIKLLTYAKKHKLRTNVCSRRCQSYKVTSSSE